MEETEGEGISETRLHPGTEILDWEYAMATLQYGPLYIAKRLETRYDDTVVGAIEKELDHLEQAEESDWIAYDVEYLLGSPVPGDMAMVLRVDHQDPFSERGVYELKDVYKRQV